MSIYKDCDIRGYTERNLMKRMLTSSAKQSGPCRGESGWRWEGISACQHRF